MATIAAANITTTPVRITPALDALGKQTRIDSLIISNSHTGSIAVNVFLDIHGSGGNPDYYIIKALKIGAGYTIDVFENTPFEIPSSTAIWISTTANRADAICNYTTIDKF